ncbi:uncharacterized protein [Ptychodera flava]|uniref:uncharacterized protein n=1 Tax=Ptychodera flava TaxID=63121 RepID=UPI00396A944C
MYGAIMNLQLFVGIAVILTGARAKRTQMNIAVAKNISGDLEAALGQLVDGDMSTCVSFKDIKEITLDLGRSFDIHRVKLRLDHKVRGRFPDVKIYTGNSTKSSRNAECLKHVIRSDSVVFGKDCHAVYRYVNVEKMKKIQSLSLCELEVIAPVCKPPVHVTDVAKGKDIMGIVEMINQTSQADHGKKTNRASGKSSDNQTAWKIDLGESFDIYQVDILNTKQCADYPIIDTQVHIGDDDENIDNNAVCDDVVQRKMVNRKRFNFHCGCDTPLRGRYVSGTLLTQDPERHTACKVRVMAG